MAFRIHDSVVRGEIDNRQKGRVTGRIWVHGRREPVRLELTGNAHPDLAGCLLKFANPLPTTPHEHLASLHPVQKGTIGDLTASRKVRVYDVPVAEAYLMSKRGEKPPEHMANCLYLEWHSERNGRVVVESTGYVLEVSAPEWRLDPDESGAEAPPAGDDPAGTEDEKEWDEFDFERAMQRSDAVTDKYLELLEKYGDSPEAEEQIAKEMGWDKEADDEGGEDEAIAEGDRLTAEDMDEILEEAERNPPQLDAATEGVDWVRTENGHIQHPLCHRVFEASLALQAELEEAGIDVNVEECLVTLVTKYQITGAKLAGALNSLGYGRDGVPAGLVVASLKRALSHLHEAQGALEKAAARKLAPEKILVPRRKEFFEVREEILRLMQEFRDRT